MATAPRRSVALEGASAGLGQARQQGGTGGPTGHHRADTVSIHNQSWELETDRIPCRGAEKWDCTDRAVSVLLCGGDEGVRDEDEVDTETRARSNLVAQAAQQYQDDVMRRQEERIQRLKQQGRGGYNSQW